VSQWRLERWCRQALGVPRISRSAPHAPPLLLELRRSPQRWAGCSSVPLLVRTSSAWLPHLTSSVRTGGCHVVAVASSPTARARPHWA